MNRYCGIFAGGPSRIFWEKAQLSATYLGICHHHHDIGCYAQPECSAENVDPDLFVDSGRCQLCSLAYSHFAGFLGRKLGWVLLRMDSSLRDCGQFPGDGYPGYGLMLVGMTLSALDMPSRTGFMSLALWAAVILMAVEERELYGVVSSSTAAIGMLIFVLISVLLLQSLSFWKIFTGWDFAMI